MSSNFFYKVLKFFWLNSKIYPSIKKNLWCITMKRSSITIQIFPFAAFFVCTFLFWPGLLRPDSITQMQQGIAGAFTDFHPPMMGFLWGFFYKIYSGSGPMFLFHLALYWMAVALFANAEIYKAKWVYFIAFLPPVFSYQLLVIKDLSFVNAYLFCAAWLHFYSMRELVPSTLSLIMWVIIAFYGTAVAYQAIVALPWLCLWLAKFYWPDRGKKWVIAGLMFFGVIIAGVELFNKTMAASSHAAQHLKLYDLAGISTKLNEPVFPDYIKGNTHYDFERVKKLYNPNRVDDLTFSSDSPLMSTVAADQLHALHRTWVGAILAHPFVYLKHRWGIFYQQLTVSLLKAPSNIKGETPGAILRILGWVENSGFFAIASWFMAYIIYFFIQLVYVYKGYKHFSEHPKYTSLFFQNIMGMMLVLSLFFVARAAEARYAYLAIAMFHFSHVFLLKAVRPSRFTNHRFA